MRILNHLIKDSEIIGIGPALQEINNTRIYRDKRLYFIVELLYRTIEIDSGWFDKDDEKGLKIAKEFLIEYSNCFNKIAVLIGEEIVTPAKKTPPKKGIKKVRPKQ